MAETPDSLRSKLADVAKAQAGVRRSGENIKRAAAERGEVIDARLAELRPNVITDQAAAEEYEALLQERGQLGLVGGL